MIAIVALAFAVFSAVLTLCVLIWAADVEWTGGLHVRALDAAWQRGWIAGKRDAEAKSVSVSVSSYCGAFAERREGHPDFLCMRTKGHRGEHTSDAMIVQ